MSTGKPSSNEEEYFAKQEIEKRRKYHQEVLKKMESEEEKKLKDAHFMHCSKCGFELHTLVFRGVEIEKCYHCGAVVLDQSEFEKFAGDGNSLINSIIGVFK